MSWSFRRTGIDFRYHFPRLGLGVVVDLPDLARAGDTFGVDKFEPMIVGIGLEVAGEDGAELVVVGDTVLFRCEPRVVD